MELLEIRAEDRGHLCFIQLGVIFTPGLNTLFQQRVLNRTDDRGVHRCQTALGQAQTTFKEVSVWTLKIGFKGRNAAAQHMIRRKQPAGGFRRQLMPLIGLDFILN